MLTHPSLSYNAKLKEIINALKNDCDLFFPNLFVDSAAVTEFQACSSSNTTAIFQELIHTIY